MSVKRLSELIRSVGVTPTEKLPYTFVICIIMLPNLCWMFFALIIYTNLPYKYLFIDIDI